MSGITNIQPKKSKRAINNNEYLKVQQTNKNNQIVKNIKYSHIEPIS